MLALRGLDFQVKQTENSKLSLDYNSSQPLRPVFSLWTCDDLIKHTKGSIRTDPTVILV